MKKKTLSVLLLMATGTVSSFANTTQSTDLKANVKKESYLKAFKQLSKMDQEKLLKSFVKTELELPALDDKATEINENLLDKLEEQGIIHDFESATGTICG